MKEPNYLLLNPQNYALLLEALPLSHPVRINAALSAWAKRNWTAWRGLPYDALPTPSE